MPKELLGPDGRPMRFNYDATVAKARRRAPSSKLLSEDWDLDATKRRKLVSTARDLTRNFSIAAWAIRLHLDYVTAFSFQSRDGNTDNDIAIERFMRRYSRADRCDVTRRFPLSRMIRLVEQRRIVDGDVLVVRLDDGRLQAVEGDRIATPSGATATERAGLVHGVKMRGSAVGEYSVCRRTSSGQLVFERFVPADNAYLHGCFERFDQLRGVSPLAPAVNTFQDCYEGMDYALAKMKVTQLFALAITRQGGNALGTTTTGDDDEYEVDFGSGPVLLDLRDGDDAKFLESDTPSPAFAEYMNQVIAVALKALDMPMCLYDESRSTFSGSRIALIQYEKSVDHKRQDVQELLDWITEWRLGLAIERGELALGDYDPTERAWDWIPRGTPWIQPLADVKADIAAIEAKLDTRSRVIRERFGRDFADVVDELAAEQEYMRSKGLTPEDMDAAIAATDGAE